MSLPMRGVGEPLRLFDFRRGAGRPPRQRRFGVPLHTVVVVVPLLFLYAPVAGAPTAGKGRPMTIDDGTPYLMSGVQTVGFWRSDGAVSPNRPCRWARSSGPEPAAAAAVAANRVAFGVAVTVRLLDRDYFISHGCRPWHFVGPADAGSPDRGL